MRVLVTGGLGYVGHAVTVDFRQAGYDVTVLRRSPEDAAETTPAGAVVVSGDLRDRDRILEIVKDGRYDAVVHLGGLPRPRESFAEPLDYFEVNVGGTLNLLRALQAFPGPTGPVPFIYASTTLVYGSRRVGSVDESVDPSPESPYADTKVAAERMVMAHAETGDCAAAILRIFNVGGGFGGVGDNDPSRIIPTLLSAAAGQRPSITLVGNGTTIRDFVHVGDVASAARAAISYAWPGACPVFNIGSGVGTRMVDLLHCVEEVTGQTISVQHTPQEGPPGRLIADIGYAKSQLRWEPVRSDLRTIVADAWDCWPGRT
jgi:UDP-glucose 4-epimerase